MTKQGELDVLMDDIASEFIAGIDGYSSNAITKISRIRSGVYDILAEYSKNDDRVSKSRLNSLLRELDAIEDEIYYVLMREVEDSVTETIILAEKRSSNALIGLLGAAAVYGAVSSRPKKDDVVRVNLKYVMNRKAVGDNTLPDILRSVSGVIREEIQAGIRYGVQRGESVTAISRRVLGAFQKTSWQIKRIIKTELPIAFRKTISWLGGKIGIIKAVKIIDHRGRHKYHETHECYRLAEQNMYGWGKGMYRPEDSFIFDPHPQCTAYYRYVLRNNWEKGETRNVERE